MMNIYKVFIMLRAILMNFKSECTHTGIRKRSISQKNKDSNQTSTSDLKQVVCNDNKQPKRPTSMTTQSSVSSSTVYLYIQV